MGEKTMEILREAARAHHVALWQAAEKLLAEQGLAARAANALQGFMQQIEILAEDTKDFSLGDQVEHVIQNSGLIEHFSREKGEKARTRIENLEELSNAAREFNPEQAMPHGAFASFSGMFCAGIRRAWRKSGRCCAADDLACSQGLEFPVVFMAGCEEGLFPHYMTKEDPKGLAEERRLCYVGMTRAMQSLYFTYAETRRLHGREVFHRPSRFIGEIPEHYLRSVRITTACQNQAPVPKKTGGLLLKKTCFGALARKCPIKSLVVARCWPVKDRRACSRQGAV